jgi:hypothetical protein
VMGADEPEEGEEYILDFGGEWEVWGEGEGEWEMEEETDVDWDENIKRVMIWRKST